MKKILCVLCAVFSVAVATADVFSTKLSPQSEPQFNAVCASISGHAVTKGGFVQTKSISALNRRIQSSGSFIISQADGICWNTAKPFPSVLAVTKTSIVQTSANGNTSVLDMGQNAVFAQFAGVLTAVFNGDAAALKANFDVYFAQDGSQWEIGLVPLDATVRAVINRISLSGGTAIGGMVLYEPNGDTVQYVFSVVTYAAGLDSTERAYFGQ